MSAPSGIVWGSIVGSKGRIGIYTSTSSTSTQTTVSIQVWFYSKWSVDDSNNAYYFNNEATSATTKIGSVSIDHTVATGTGWSTSNQTKLGSYSYTYTRTTSAQTKYCAAKLSGINVVSDGAAMTVSTSYTIPALASYTVSYNANGGSGAPSSRTKYYGINITLSSTKPTRTGYTFKGWSTSSSSSTVSYAAGATFGLNANTTLYAVWKANTYTVSYNANGGSGAPSSQTKTYGVTLTLSTTKPTRTNYTFKGWGTSSTSTTVAYAAGASYTANATITLYAIWELAYTAPRISTLTVSRCTSDGTVSDEGTYGKAYVVWATDLTVSSIIVYWKLSTATTWSSTTVSARGTSGSFTQIFGSGALSTESLYNVKVTVTDSSGSTTKIGTISATVYTIDALKGGNGVSFGLPATKSGYLDSNFYGYFRKGMAITARNPITSTDEDTYANWFALGNMNTFWYNTAGCLNDQPSQYGFLLNIAVHDGADAHQLWFAQSSGSVYHRSGNSSGWAQSWKELIDSDGGTINGHLQINRAQHVQMRLNNPLTGTNNNTVLCFVSGDADKWHIGHAYTQSNAFGIYDCSNSTWPLLILPNGGAATFKYYTKLNNTINTVGYYRMHTEWIGCYASSSDAQNNTNRKGWFGFNSTTNFYVTNNSSGSNITSVAWTTSSDKRMKTDIEDLPDVFVDIWKELLPKVFHWNELNSTNKKYHFGLIAQDVIAAFEKYDLDPNDYGFVNTFTIPDDETEYYGVAYDEYHMLTSLVVRKQQSQIDNLQSQIDEIKALLTKTN